jgi:O-antigen ligase
MLPVQIPLQLLLAGSFIAVLAFIILLKRPLAGLFLLLALTPVETVLGLPFQYTKAAKLTLTAVLAGVYFLRYAGTPGRRAQYPYLWAQVLFCVSGVAATLASSGPANSALGVLQLVVVFSLCYLIAGSPVSMEAGVQMLRLIVFAAAIVAPLGLLQMVFGYGGFLGSVEQQADAAAGIYDFSHGLFRSAATFNGSNSAAAFFGGAFVVSVLHASVYRRTRSLYAGLAVLIGCAAISTFSRGAFVGAFAAICLLFPVRDRALKWAVIATVIVAAAGIFVFDPPEELRFLIRPGQGTLSRILAWQESLAILRDHWITGIGIYGFQPFVELNWPNRDIPRQPHNGLLKAVVEQGIMGGIGYILFAFAFVRTSISGLRGELRGTPRWFVLAGIAAMGTCFFLQELFDAGFVAGGSSLAVVLAVLLGVQSRLLYRLPVRGELARRKVPVLSRVSRV